MLSPPYFLGIPGITPGSAMITASIIGGIIIWFIRGMADRRRAANEGITVLSGANDILFKNLTKEVARLTKMVSDQDRRIREQGKRISELERELSEARALVDQVRKDELGAIRASAQNDLSTLKVLKGVGE